MDERHQENRTAIFKLNGQNLKQGTKVTGKWDEANMEENISEDDLSVLRQAYSLIDINSDGSLSSKEMMSMLRSLSKNPTEAEVQTMIRKLDYDGNGTIEFEEFVRAIQKSRSEEKELDDNRQTFQLFDQNGDGYLGADDIANMMALTGETLTEAEVKEIIDRADTDGDGKISFHEFVAVIDGSNS